MGRIRTVKPELLTHEDLFIAEQETGFPLRIAFVGLFTQCDREGRFKWRPGTLKLGVLPFDQLDFSRVLDALMTRGFICKYAVDGVEFGMIPTFGKHQVINNREAQSEIPEPKENSFISTTSTREPRVNHAITTPLMQDQGEGKGRERKGKGTEGDSAPAKADAELFPGVDQQIISDFKALRKAKRATITSTAMQTIAAEAERAGLSLNDALRLCCARGWQGFKAEWILDRVAGAQATKNNMQVNHLDHSSSKRAMEESMRKHGITEIPEGEIKF